MTTINDLKFDNKNFNKGNHKGKSLIKKSIQKLGFGKSILVDKDNNTIAGNKVLENAIENGTTKIVVVETTGDALVVVKRTDLKLDSKKGRELALVDNLASEQNLSWDASILQEWGKDLSDWGDFGSEKMTDEWVVPSFVEPEKDAGKRDNAKIETTPQKQEASGMIVINLTDTEYENWLSVKEKIGKRRDKDAFFELLKMYSDESDIV